MGEEDRVLGRGKERGGGIGGWRGIQIHGAQGRWKNPYRSMGIKGMEGGGCADPRWRDRPWKGTWRPDIVYFHEKLFGYDFAISI